ncbi:MAG: hypothetical protein WCO78_00625 [Candidatus Roizmanbacteria bacterium]
MSGIVESVGRLGLDNSRSDNRSSLTMGERPTSRDLWRQAVNLRRGAQENQNTRGQLKFLGSADMIPPLAHHLIDAEFNPTSESTHNPTLSGVVFMSANSPERHDNDLRRHWAIAAEYWRSPLRLTPHERMYQLNSQGYSIDTHIQQSDVSRLARIWEPFGWTSEGVSQFIDTYSPTDPHASGWFSCMRNSDGQICSAAKAEALRIGEMELVESTEWGTLAEERGRGLGTGAAIGLNRAILSIPPDGAFCIMAEANLAPHLPGHKVARDAGFSPAGGDIQSATPNHILEAHVSVDGALRSFLPVQLTPEAVASYY